MGPKKKTGKPAARSNNKTAAAGLETPANPGKLKRSTKKDQTQDGVPKKRTYKPRAKKQSLVLSLQSSPDIKESKMSPYSAPSSASRRQQPSPLMMHIPRLDPDTGRRRSDSSAHKKKDFVEPELAPAQPGYSGHTLESLPPLKLKRGLASGRGRKWKSMATTRVAAAPPTEAELSEREAAYKQHLQTKQSESITDESGLRTPVKPPTKKRGRPAKDRAGVSTSTTTSTATTTTIEIPETPGSKGRPHGSPGSISVKRIKIISPKRSNALLGTAAPVPPDPPSETNDNDDFCSNCGGTGVFICCDTCPRSFHLLCCDPPLRDVPEENWNCRACEARAGPNGQPSWNDAGMFGPMLNTVHGRTPTEFCLPKKLRDSTFIGVSTGDNHAYFDSSAKPELSMSKANGAQIAGFNKDDSLDVDALYDDDGNPYLCHKCGLSGLRHRSFTFCDYCPLVWHLDCLPMPMCSAKTKGQKWRCPNHVDSLLPSFWTDRRSFKDALVLDAAAQNNFLRFASANNFLIKYAHQPCLAESSETGLQEYQQFQARSFVSSDTETVDYLKAEYDANQDSDEETESEENVTPAYLQNFAAGDRIVAKTSQQSAKLLIMTNADDPDHRPFVYRVPEQQILLDFVDKSKSKSKSKGRSKSQSIAKKQGILDEIQRYDDLIDSDRSQELEAVRALVTFHNHEEIKQDIPEASTRQMPTEMSHPVHGPRGSETTVSVSAAIENALFSETGEVSEEEQLRHIRKLVQMKGKDALLQFLAS